MSTFTTLYNIDRNNIEFLDIPVNEDLTAFICPFLIANNRDNRIMNRVYLVMQNFLTKLNREFVQPNDWQNGLKFLDHLHEPNEYHLGYSDRNVGKAISKTKAEIVFGSLRENRFARQGSSITNEAHHVLLLVKGIGQDNMSDTIANVCRHIFAEFTEEQCTKHNVPTHASKISFYDEFSREWQEKIVNLPFHKGKPIILLPLKATSGRRAYTTLYNWFVCSKNIASELLKENIDKGTKYVRVMKDGTKKAIIKSIYQAYAKPKLDLIDFVLKYPGSLLAFQLYAKENFPELDITDISD